MKAVLSAFVMLLMFLTTAASAGTECAGETHAGTIVRVAISTVGAMGFPKGAQVTIVPKDGAARAYRLVEDEIAQFFETENGPSAFVGLAAYQGLNNPIWIRYVGTNYQDDLAKILRAPGRLREDGNEMRVWKGPGYSANEQYSFADVVCTVALDP